MRYKIKSRDWIRAAAGGFAELFIGALVLLAGSFLFAIVLMIYFKIKGF